MSFRLVISRPDAPRLRWRVTETRKRLRDLRPAFAAAEGPVRSVITAWFNAQGHGWAPLSPKTVAARANKWGYYRTGFREQASSRILHARHVLRDSLTKSGGKNISHFTRRRWEFGSKVRYASVHHTGGLVGAHRSALPARKLVPLSDALPRAVLGPINTHVLFAWRQNYPGGA